MKFTKDLVELYADKLLIGLSNEEKDMVWEEFKAIDKNINKINEIKDLEKYEPMTFPFPVSVSLSEDKPISSIPANILLKNCDDVKGQELEVPKVVGNE